VVTENDSNSAGGREPGTTADSGEVLERSAITGSGEFRKGAQVVNTTGLPDGYVPPSASLSPPLPSDDAGAAQSD
jgi:hypothetical protein